MELLRVNIHLKRFGDVFSEFHHENLEISFSELRFPLGEIHAKVASKPIDKRI